VHPDKHDDYVEHFTKRVVQDALAEATAAYWRRRAAVFRDARPRAGDYNGRATSRELRDRHRRLSEVADACEGRAHMSTHLGTEVGL